ncbi:MAG: type II methionyl aminopeptidase [Candidatus Micrarchaeota archaeon]|nr:type II methionyl aminopeptidase [Candidatus Micrarchaeota archaeon]
MDYDYKTLKEAGKVSYAALEYSRSVIKPGVSLLDAADKIEKFITDKGYAFSFPTNLSANQYAAHYTPDVDDKSVFGERDLVKVDIGARKEMCLTDCAITIDLSGANQKLIDASDAALSNAISMIKAGVHVRDIGKEIEKTVSAKGLKVIRNLGGHGIEQDELHADVFIPNYDNGDETELEEGQVVAIEPFVTDGAGYVEEGESLQIYQKIDAVSLRSREARAVSEYIDQNFMTYPFAVRWLIRGLPNLGDFSVRKGIAELLYAGTLEPFPVLVEKGRGMVSQSEKELIVEKDSCTIVTA